MGSMAPADDFPSQDLDITVLGLNSGTSMVRMP